MSCLRWNVHCHCHGTPGTCKSGIGSQGTITSLGAVLVLSDIAAGFQPRVPRGLFRSGQYSTIVQFRLSAVRHIWLQWIWFVRAWKHSNGDYCAYPTVPVGNGGERNSLVLFTPTMANYPGLHLSLSGTSNIRAQCRYCRYNERSTLVLAADGFVPYPDDTQAPCAGRRGREVWRMQELRFELMISLP